MARERKAGGERPGRAEAEDVFSRFQIGTGNTLSKRWPGDDIAMTSRRYTRKPDRTKTNAAVRTLTGTIREMWFPDALRSGKSQDSRPGLEAGMRKRQAYIPLFDKRFRAGAFLPAPCLDQSIPSALAVSIRPPAIRHGHRFHFAALLAPLPTSRIDMPPRVTSPWMHDTTRDARAAVSGIVKPSACVASHVDIFPSHRHVRAMCRRGRHVRRHGERNRRYRYDVRSRSPIQ